ncbi:hypothetical protein [Subtercola sp. RTI3]|uniref:hypothetical protein n=1 Tax=Subtercola sp. RTI3 TaxID=3048639 RepID=UPI002B22274A|nr:hypothetical protein [Subtercola sp. RTI3]MEA9985651.1 hypothetical protein [Subtercola sp. RTI3]
MAKKKLRLAGYSALLAGAALLAGCAPDNSMSNLGENLPTSTPVTTSPTATNGAHNVPAAATDFVVNNKAGFADPLAAWYAVQAYQAGGGYDETVLDPTYISTYAYPSAMDGLGPGLLIFRPSVLPLNAPIKNQDVKPSIALFNGEFVGNLTRYLNLVARNQSPSALKVIDNEFTIYCGQGNEYTSKLLGDLRTIGLNYGTAAVFTVEPGSTDETTTGTLFSDNFNTTIDNYDAATNTVLAFSNIVSMRIKVDVYDDNNLATHSVYSLDEVQIAFERFIPAGQTGVDPTYMTIGIK